MFARPDGRPYDEGHLVDVFQDAVKQAGVIKRATPRPYDLRGTFVVHRTAAGASNRQVQYELGHLSSNALRNYLDAASHLAAADSIFAGVDVTAGWRERL